MATTNTLDTQELEQRVKEMYREVAEDPHKEFHFETGRALASGSGTRPRSSTRSQAPRSTRSPESATTSTWPRSSRARRSSTLEAAREWTASSPRARWEATVG